jgi:hypothetical protein
MVYKYDLSRLQAAGYSVERVWPTSRQILNPFHPCDMATLRLESQNNDAWVFTSKPIREMEQMHIALVRITLGKADGILRKSEYIETNPSLFTVCVLTDVRVNSALSDDSFHYTPPSGVEVKDLTDSEIGRMRG